MTGKQSGTAAEAVSEEHFFMGWLFSFIPQQGRKNMKGNWLKSLFAAGLAVSLAACSSGSSAASSTASAGTETAAAASGDSAIVVATSSQFTTLDPALNTETVNNHVITHIYSGMFRTDTSGVAQPELADSYEVSDDGLTYTFHLKSGITWSDGTPITAGDFVYSYLRALSYGADNAWAIYDMTSFIQGAAEYNQAALEAGGDFDCTTADHSYVGIEAPDDQTLVLTLKVPCTYLPGLMTSNVWTPVPQGTPQHDSLWSMTAGYATSGPYTLTDFNENDKAVLVKNDSYFDADSITMNQITFQVMTDQDSQAVAFQSGEIDIADSVTIDTAKSYEGTDSLWLLNTPVNYFLAINSGDTGPDWAKDVNVRKALAEAIDKDALADVLGGTDFYPVLNGYIPFGLAGNDGDFRDEGDKEAEEKGLTISYDPDDAKALLAAAGYDESNPLHITYKYSNSGIHGDVATVLQQMWQAVGIEVDFEAVESGVFYDQLDQGDFEIARYGYSAGDSPIQFLDLWTTGIQVTAAVDDATFDQMVADIKQIADPAEFITKCHEAEEYLYYENVYVIPLFQYTSQYLVNADLAGYELDGTNTFYGHAYFK